MSRNNNDDDSTPFIEPIQAGNTQDASEVNVRGYQRFFYHDEMEEVARYIARYVTTALEDENHDRIAAFIESYASNNNRILLENNTENSDEDSDDDDDSLPPLVQREDPDQDNDGNSTVSTDSSLPELIEPTNNNEGTDSSDDEDSTHVTPTATTITNPNEGEDEYDYEFALALDSVFRSIAAFRISQRLEGHIEQVD